MTEKFRKRMYRLLYLWMFIAGVIAASALIVLVIEGVQGLSEAWYGKTIVIAGGIWVFVVVIVLFSIVGIKTIRGDYG